MTTEHVKLPILDVWQQRLEFRVNAPAQLPDWLGSSWRGVFGNQLKQLSCVTGLPECVSCPLFSSCSHAEIFESPPKQQVGKMRKYNAVPHPYVLLPDPGGNVDSNTTIAVEVRLFGQAIRHHRLVTDALKLGAKQGLGRSRVSLLPTQLADAQILTVDSAASEPPQGPLRIRFLSPLRMRIKGRPVGPEQLTFGDFFSVLLRRISMLSSFYQRHNLDIDFRHLVSQARSIEFSHRDLHMASRSRWSNRQQHAIDMSGIIGEVKLNTELVHLFWPYLYLGQYTLVGKGTVMGLGQYRID